VTAWLAPEPAATRESVHAVLVTYNRRELLRQALHALASQERAPNAVLVVDNASSDGTVEMVRAEFPTVQVLALSQNEGGAGGFHEGMRWAFERGADWLWLMDDDTIPRPSALAELLAAADRLRPQINPMLLASKALWNDGRMHPMNVPGSDRDRMPRVVLGAELGLMPLRSATFVSLLVHRSAVERYGLPFKRFFIWSDDIDYTNRILQEDAGFLVPTSVVEHRTSNPHTAMSATPERFYYHVRNTLFMIRGPDRRLRERIILLWVLLSSMYAYVAATEQKRATFGFIWRGLRDGVRLVGGPGPSPRSTSLPSRDR
jgi:GT2 family glycosyltransferase